MNYRSKKKTYIIFILLFIVFLSINTNLIWQLMYPIKYEEEIKYYTSEFGTNPYLVLSVIKVETSFNADKISSAGAMGLMQLMPNTANWIIEEGDFSEFTEAEIMEPDVNIALGSWYLSYIYERFDGNVYVTIAAYNAGPGNVTKWLNDGVWDGTVENIDQIPIGETRHYIQRVLHYYNRYKWVYEDQF